MNAIDQFAEVHKQIMWNRLLSIVEEQAQTLIRTAFSTSVRESGDLSAGIFDVAGSMLAQAVTGTPGHVNSMAIAVKHFIAKFPVSSMNEGDHFITNDPWITCGHLHDITVVSPAFLDGRPVALCASTVHVVDIGGRGFGPDARQVFEEGLYIPLMYLARGGVMNSDLLEIVRGNVREPVQVEGDLFSLAACNDDGCRRLIEMMREFGIADLKDLATYIIETSYAATVREIAKLKPGTYRNTIVQDGYDFPVKLVATMTIDAGSIHVDYTGSSAASAFGINVVMNYCDAYTTFGVKCIVAPEIPNNAGSLRPIHVSAPEGSILNVKHPWAVAARHIIGQTLPDVVFGCLYQVVPDRVPAEGAASLWNPALYGGPSVVNVDMARHRADHARDFSVAVFNSGGMGGRPSKDGLSATAFPSGIRTMPVEVIETVAPVVIRRKELRPDSAGPGEHRGGFGQSIEVAGLGGVPFVIYAMFDRVQNPAPGRQRGENGAAGKVMLGSGPSLQAKGKQVIPAGDSLCLEVPGGGGFGDPLARDPAKVHADVADELVSEAQARERYGVVIADNRIDMDATSRLREKIRLERDRRTAA